MSLRAQEHRAHRRRPALAPVRGWRPILVKRVGDPPEAHPCGAPFLDARDDLRPYAGFPSSAAGRGIGGGGPTMLSKQALELVDRDQHRSPGQLDRLDVREEPTKARWADTQRLCSLSAGVSEAFDMPGFAHAWRVLSPREDRDLEARLFASSGADSIRTSIARACRAAGVARWSPHDLRHRRISLLHRQGRTWAEIGARVGQRSLKVTSDTYTHVLVDGRELDYTALLALG